MFCIACREEIATKKSSIESHLKSLKHVDGKKRLALKSKREADIVSTLKICDSQLHPVGNSLPYSTRVYRVKVVTTMLKTGIPLSKMDYFRELLEEPAYALTSSANLRQLVPLIQQEEMSRIKREILNRPVSTVFD